MKKILITGANSYIGINVETWLKQYGKSYEIDTLDMTKKEWEKHDFSAYDVVFHVAGIAHADVGKVTEEIKQKYYDINTKLAVETAKKAKLAGVRQFIFMSSMIVYGGAEHITSSTKPKPANFYGDSKWQADCGIRALENEQFKVVILRPPMIYGKGSKGNYPLLAKLAKKLPVFPKVKNKRSVLYIENLCEFIKLIIDNENRGIYFPQNEKLVSTSDIVTEIARASGHRIWITAIFVPLVYIAKHMPGKIGNMSKKAFGSSYYDMEMSEYEEDYRCFGFEPSIIKTEE